MVWEWTEENYAERPNWWTPSAYEERGLEFADFMERTRQQNEEGLPVRMEVPRITWRDGRRALLMINCKPLPNFPHRSTMAKTVKLFHEGNRYHISLCFVSELPEGGWEAYERLRQRYEGRTGVLRVHVLNAQAALLPGLNELTDEILNDPDVTLLHNAGDYKSRPLHVST